MSQSRKQQALEIRINAATMAHDRLHAVHLSNSDELRFRHPDGTLSHLASFTKGMPHDYVSGLLSKPKHFQQFIKGINSGLPQDFKDTPLGPAGYPLPVGKGWHANTLINEVLADNKKQIKQGKGQGNLKLRAWESQAAGQLFDLQGPDAQAVSMPPAPKFGSAELTAEMAEVYVQALLRDVPFTEIVAAGHHSDLTYTLQTHDGDGRTIAVSSLLQKLKDLAWFNEEKNNLVFVFEQGQHQNLSQREASRARNNLDGQTFFRGLTPGDNIGPYISQFLLAGGHSINGSDNEQGRTKASGLIAFGANNIDQRVRIASPDKDYLTTWDAWYDVQQAADFTKTESYTNQQQTLPDGTVIAHTRRFITTPRDLATYVHYDALYQAYLNACLMLLAEGIPLDPGIPYQDEDHIDHQQGFAHFGGPHILSLVTEVATRALKAVRFQKFNIHRRLRPEALAARLTKQAAGQLSVPELAVMLEKMLPILGEVNTHNVRQNSQTGEPLGQLPEGLNFLLPMAFAEGSPMHPSYGAGHATVAGACVTILKAFFDHTSPLKLAGDEKTAFVANHNGTQLLSVPVENGNLTVEGELNKLASNIAIGRNWAGVHYFSDYIESLRMGEQIALGILQEQKLTYSEGFTMTVPLFDGTTISI
jgi:hypothetical protein